MTSELEKFEVWVAKLRQVEWRPDSAFYYDVVSISAFSKEIRWRLALEALLNLLEEPRNPWWLDDMGTAHTTIHPEQVLEIEEGFPTPPKDAWTLVLQEKFQAWLSEARRPPATRARWERWALGCEAEHLEFSQTTVAL